MRKTNDFSQKNESKMRKTNESMRSDTEGLYKLNAKGTRVENYDSETAEKIKMFNQRHKMSPITSMPK